MVTTLSAKARGYLDGLAAAVDRTAEEIAAELLEVLTDGKVRVDHRIADGDELLERWRIWQAEWDRCIGTA